MFIGTIKNLDFANVTSNLPENDAPVYNAGTTYNIGDEVLYNHYVYGCLVQGTLNKRPDLFSSRFQTPQYWQAKSVTNAFAAVDGVLAVATINPAGSVVINISNFANAAAIGIFDAAGDLATAKFYDGSNTLIQTQEITLGGFNFNSYHDWLFTQPLSGNNNHIFRDFPAATVRVQMTISGASTQLGEISIIETGYNIGEALYGSQINIASRSIYQDDEFGVPRYIQRPSRINANFEVKGGRSFIETLWGRLRKLSGLRVVYEAEKGRTTTTGVGIVRDISVPVDLPNDYMFSIEIEGVQ